MTLEQAAVAGVAGLVLVGLVVSIVRGRRGAAAERSAPAHVPHPLDEDPIVAAIARRADEGRR